MNEVSVMCLNFSCFNTSIMEISLDVESDTKVNCAHVFPIYMPCWRYVSKIKTYAFKDLNKVMFASLVT